jgi:hypothetical protein
MLQGSKAPGALFCHHLQAGLRFCGRRNSLQPHRWPFLANFRGRAPKAIHFPNQPWHLRGDSFSEFQLSERD